MLGRTLALIVSLSLCGCAHLADEMARAEELYDDARYEASLEWFNDLEHRVPEMDLTMQAHFYYLRGMTALRLEDRDGALYYLSLAHQVVELGGTLDEDEVSQTNELLARLTPTEATHHARPREIDQ